MIHDTLFNILAFMTLFQCSHIDMYDPAIYIFHLILEPISRRLQV